MSQKSQKVLKDKNNAGVTYDTSKMVDYESSDHVRHL